MIRNKIEAGLLPQGYELRQTDVGKPLAYDFGYVMRGDIGKKVWVKPYGLVMENNEQRDKRKGKSNPRKRLRRRNAKTWSASRVASRLRRPGHKKLSAIMRRLRKTKKNRGRRKCN